MFTWFGEQAYTFNQIDSIDANILLFSRSFLSTLIMKAWLTCALDTTCIAPVGSRLNPCCGCHRFDQSALTIITTYFYAHPKNDSILELPAYGFTKNESYFYAVKRGSRRKYFKNRTNQLVTNKSSL